MKRTFILPITASLLVAGLQAPLQAADQSDAQLALLYQKLHAVLGGNSLDKNSTLILASPGTPLSQDFDPAHNDADADLLNEMADQVPKANEVFIPNAGWTYSGIYSKIMQNKQTLPNPPVPLTADEQARLDEANAKVATGSELRTAFDAANDAYQSAMATWMNAQTLAKALNEYSATLYKDPSATAEAKRDAAVAAGTANSDKAKAESAYLTATKDLQGKANTINKYFNTIQELTAKDGAAWWVSLSDKFNSAKHNSFYSVSFFPPAVGWNNPAVHDWTTFSFKAGEKTSSESASSRDIEAAVGFHKGSVSVSGDFAMHNSNMDAAMAASDFECRFDIKRVNVYRRWWDPDVFKNRCWFLPQSVGNGMLSFGNLADNKKKDPPLPVYVTSFFLIKNLKITSSYLKDHKAEFAKSISAHVKVSVGPFDASAGYSQSDSGKHAEESAGSGSIECPGIQIIGYMASVPSRTPNPDPKLMAAPKS